MAHPRVRPAHTGEPAHTKPERASAAHLEADSEEHDHPHKLSWRDFNRVIFVAAAAGAIWFARESAIPYLNSIGVLCALVGGYPIYHEAYENIVQRRMTMELSMAIAIIAALAIRETFTALVITLFVLAAEILEGLTVGRGRTAIRRLLDLLPRATTVRRGSDWRDVAIEDVLAGDVVLVRPGGHIPVDGTVVGGNSFVDQAAITGESLPVEKLAGAGVYAGTINQSGALEIRVERLGRDTDVRTNHRGSGTRGKIARSDSKDGRPARRLPGLFRARCRRADVSDHAQCALDDFRDYCGRRLRYCGRNSPGGPGSHWPSRAKGRHHQGRAVPGSAFASGYRRAR